MISVVIVIAVVIFIFFRIKINRNEKNPISIWFDWKIRHTSSDQQEVVNYFKIITPIFLRARETQYSRKNSPWGHPNPSKAAKITEDSLANIKKIIPPQYCTKHYNLTLEILSDIKECHEKRMQFSDTKIFEDKTKKMRLNQKILEVERQKEFFNILRKVGLYDNIEKEMYNLGVISDQEKSQLKIERQNHIEGK